MGVVPTKKWQWIWKVACNQRARIFLWLCKHLRLPTNSFLHQRIFHLMHLAIYVRGWRGILNICCASVLRPRFFGIKSSYIITCQLCWIFSLIVRSSSVAWKLPFMTNYVSHGEPSLHINVSYCWIKEITLSTNHLIFFPPFAREYETGSRISFSLSSCKITKEETSHNY